MRGSVIRPACAADRPAIVAMVRAARLLPFGLAWPRFIVAESAGHLVGAGQLKAHRDGSREIGSLVVLEPYRRRGIGGLIVRGLLEQSDQTVYVICPAHLESYYEHFGFQRAALKELTPYFQAAAGVAYLVGLIRRARGQRRDVRILRRAVGREQ